MRPDSKKGGHFLLRVAPVVALIVLLVLSFRVQSQSTSTLHFGIQEGLPSAEVYEVYQDHSGFIWFATDNGVVRYDGHEMKIFQGTEGLHDPVIFGFYEDEKGRLWFRSFSGRLSYLKNETISSYRFNDTIAKICSTDVIRSIRVDTLDNVWISSSRFTGRITADGHPLFHISRRDDFQYWKDNNDCGVEWKGRRFVSYEKALYEVVDHHLQRIMTASHDIISLSRDRADNVWIGYLNKDCERYSSPDFSHPSVPRFLKGQSVTSVYQDAQMGYWISTLKNGVYYIPDFPFVEYTFPFSATFRAVVAGNNVVVATEKGQLLEIDGRSLQVVRTAQIDDGALVEMFVDSKKNIWISTRRNAFVYDSVLRFRERLSFSIKGFYEDRFHHVWGYDNSRVIQFNPEGGAVRTKSIEFMHRSIVGSGPFVVMSSRTGVDVFDSAFNLVSRPSVVTDFKIPRIANLQDSAILMETIGNGFFITRTDDWTTTQYVGGKNFIARNVYCAGVVDTVLWIGTENGIAMTSVHSLIAGRPVFRMLTAKNGLVADKVDQLLEVKENVWAISGNSVAILPRLAATRPLSGPHFYWKSMQVNSTAVDPNQPSLAFNSDQNDIEFKFGFVDFSNAALFIRSRLTSSDVWSLTTTRELHYDKLAPGQYTFQMEYSFDSKEWRPIATHLSFTIRQYWYLRWYAIVGYFLLLLTAFYISLRIRVAVLHEKNLRLNMINDHRRMMLLAEIEAMEKERSRIAKDLHDGAGMGLTLLKLKLHQVFARTKANKEDAEEVLTQINSTIHEIRDTIHNLTPPGLHQFGLANSLRAYIEKNVSTLNVKIDFHESGPGILDPGISLSCYRILQELISNSLKHSGAAEIGIHIHNFDNDIDILYTDNGKGFVREKENPGNGLLNIESRIEHLDGTMEFSSGEFGVSYHFKVSKNVAKDKHLAGG